MKPKRQPKRPAVEIILDDQGRASVAWWTLDAAAILSTLGPAEGIYRNLNDNPYCG
jgi:hypothetical protein